jgi:hypothetical protein
VNVIDNQAGIPNDSEKIKINYYKSLDYDYRGYNEDNIFYLSNDFDM